jgi:hypothetical protein
MRRFLILAVLSAFALVGFGAVPVAPPGSATTGWSAHAASKQQSNVKNKGGVRGAQKHYED